MFYGRENAENRGITKFYSRVHGSENAKDDPFALHMEESEFITLSFCIVNTIPDYGEVLYGKSIDGNNREELYDLLENLTIKCGSEIYTDAVMHTFPRYNCFDISIKKEVYSKLKGEIEILYPLVSLNLKEK